MSEHKYTGPIAGIFQKMADLIGKDVYFVNFLILMFLTLFEVAAVFFTQIPFTEIEITRGAVWGVLIIIGIVKGYGIAAFFMHLKGDPFIYKPRWYRQSSILVYPKLGLLLRNRALKM
jgi:hypothetical protein